MLYVIPATRRHTWHLARFLRKADADEVLALAGMDPAEAMKWSFEITPDPLTVMYENVPCGMFGVVPVPNTEHGCIWLVGSELLTCRMMEFGRASLEFIDRLIRPYALVGNMVDVRNTVHSRWLEWLGAEFAEPTQHGTGWFRSFYVRSSSSSNGGALGRFDRRKCRGSF